MKNARIIISITLVALATTSVAQLSNLKDKLYHSKTDISSVAYTSETTSFKDWTADLRGRLDHGNLSVSGSPSVSRTFFASHVEVIYENESGLESWMSEPFKFETDEEDLSIESWMTKPFLSSSETEDLKLESWMAVPFETEAEIEVSMIADKGN